MHRSSILALAIVGGLAVLTFGPAPAQQEHVAKKKTSDQAANFVYPGAKRLDQRNVGSIYQGLFTTTDDLSKVAEWYDKKLAGLVAGQMAGVSNDGDGTRRAIIQDGERLDLEALAKRPVSARSYLVRAKSHTISVVISRPPGGTSAVILLSYMPE